MINQNSLEQKLNTPVQMGTTGAANAMNNAEDSNVINAFASIYTVVWIYDFALNKVKVLRDREDLEEVAAKLNYDSDATVTGIINNFVEEDDKGRIWKIFDKQNLIATLARDRQIVYEYRDTSMGWCRVTIVPVLKSDGSFTSAIIGVQKIDNEKKKELHAKEMLAAAYAEAQKANEAKTDFLSRMSHDIRTPLNGIIGMSKIATQSLGNCDKVGYSLKRIEECSHQLEQLINDVLDMSKLESGKVELTREKFHLQKMIQSMGQGIELSAREKGINLLGSHFNQKHNMVIGSPVHIQRIILNIMSNSVKYTNPNGSIEAWLEEKPLDDNHAAFTFIMSDTGIGMSEKFLKHIFDPFSRERTDAGTHYQGTGLGMAITKELVDMMGGTIEIESQLGVGSTFRITIPMELCAEEDNQAEEKQAEKPDISGIRILLAEDNEVNREIAVFLLEQAGAQVTCAVNGYEAVKTYTYSPAGTFDMILMDIRMPLLDGYEATHHIRQSGLADAHSIPIIAMTANAFVEDVRKCLAHGMNDHIAKPLDVDITLSKIAKYYHPQK